MAAVHASTLKVPDSSVRRNLGLLLPVNNDKYKDLEKFPNSKGDPKSPLELITDGAMFEDSNIRPLFHFFDPLNDEGLVFFTSPTWALEDNGNTHVLQNYSYRDAREYEYKALTLTDNSDRKNNFGKTFESLGRVIHHVQDMAQPQHVRLDAHLNLGWTNEELFFENRSRYEIYTEEIAKGRIPGALPDAGYAPVNNEGDTTFLATARSFWHTENKNPAAGKGMAEFTNTNFVSAGTNFDTNRYSLPSKTATIAHDEPIDQLFQSIGKPIPAECQPPKPPCVMKFYSTQVTDRYRPATSNVNPRAATESITDVYLQVVYRGKLGAEDDAVVVATQDVAEPTFFAYMNSSEYIHLGASVYTRDQIDADAALLAQVQPRGCIDSVTGKLKSSCFQPFDISMTLDFRKTTAVAGPTVTVSGLPVRQFYRIALLTDKTGDAVANQAGVCYPLTPFHIDPLEWQDDYDATQNSVTTTYPDFTRLRGVYGWYQTSCVTYGDGDTLGSPDDREIKMNALNPIPAPTAVQVTF